MDGKESEWLGKRKEIKLPQSKLIKKKELARERLLKWA
jgi:hypothetical protein